MALGPGHYQLAGTGGVAEASLPGGAGEAVAAVDAGRGDGGEGAGAAKKRERAHEKRDGLHSEYSNENGVGISYFDHGGPARHMYSPAAKQLEEEEEEEEEEEWSCCGV
jgi:hypothetical protein